jgi:hypothetical protein
MTRTCDLLVRNSKVCCTLVFPKPLGLNPTRVISCRDRVFQSTREAAPPRLTAQFRPASVAFQDGYVMKTVRHDYL